MFAMCHPRRLRRRLRLLGILSMGLFGKWARTFHSAANPSGEVVSRASEQFGELGRHDMDRESLNSAWDSVRVLSLKSETSPKGGRTSMGLRLRVCKIPNGKTMVTVFYYLSCSFRL